jgi:hypothetical protein
MQIKSYREGVTSVDDSGLGAGIRADVPGGGGAPQTSWAYGRPRRRWSSAYELGDARTFPAAAEQRRRGRGRWGATHGGKRGWWTRGERKLRGPCGGRGTTTWEAWPSGELGQDLADEEGQPLLWGRR